jgi:thioredoxin-like negative regulator of GroEL
MLRVDVLESREIADNFKVKTVPQIILFKEGMYFDYTGGLEA